MGWILQGISEVIVSVIGDLLSFLLSCFANFELDIGYSENTTWGDLFSLDYYKNATGLVDSMFPEASLFFPLFTYIGYEMVIIALTFKVVTAMTDPTLSSSESPIRTVGKAVVASLGVAYSYTIFIMIEMIANGIYGLFKNQFEAIRAEDLPDILDYILEPNIFFENPFSGSNLLLFFLEIGLFCTLIFQFLRLLLEAFERYIVLAFMFYTCPLAFASIIFGKGCEIFKRWIQMLFSTFITISANLFFLSVFYAGFSNTFSPAGEGLYIFVDGADFIMKMCVLIAWLTIGQKVDEMLRNLGLSVAQTGSGLGSAVFVGLGSAVKAAGTAIGLAGKGMSYADDLRKGQKEAAEHDLLGSQADEILKNKGDAHDTVRAAATSSELEAHLAGTGDAFTSDCIGSDGQRPTFGDLDTRDSMAELGVSIPSYGTASMSDGKVTVSDSDGAVIGEVGDAQRWETPGGAAMFTEQTENGAVVRAATQEDISSATSGMITSLEANSNMSDGISWQPYVNESGEDTGLAIGYDESGSAKYAAYVDGACSMNSDYGRVHEYTTVNGETRRMSGIEIPHSNGTTYRVQNLQDTEHQTKHFESMENFTQNGVKFNQAASSRTLVKKSVAAQNAYSFARAEDKQRWKASTQARERDVRTAEKIKIQSDPRFEKRSTRISRKVRDR